MTPSDTPVGPADAHGRPRIPIGSHGTITTRREGSRPLAETRVRDLDGRVRQVRVFAPTATAAQKLLMHVRPAFEHNTLAESPPGGSGGSWPSRP